MFIISTYIVIVKENYIFLRQINKVINLCGWEHFFEFINLLLSLMFLSDLTHSTITPTNWVSLGVKLHFSEVT